MVGDGTLRRVRVAKEKKSSLLSALSESGWDTLVHVDISAPQQLLPPEKND